MPDFKLEIGGSIPGEALLVALLRYSETHRASMSQENRDAYDKLLIAQARGWHNFWVENGWPGERV